MGGTLSQCLFFKNLHTKVRNPWGDGGAQRCTKLLSKELSPKHKVCGGEAQGQKCQNLVKVQLSVGHPAFVFFQFDLESFTDDFNILVVKDHNVKP